MVEQGRVLSRSEIAADWFDRVYLPATAAIRQASFEGVCPRATEADRFLWIEQYRRTLLLECDDDRGCGSKGNRASASKARRRDRRLSSEAATRARARRSGSGARSAVVLVVFFVWATRRHAQLLEHTRTLPEGPRASSCREGR
jgi:hypothetical protein